MLTKKDVALLVELNAEFKKFLESYFTYYQAYKSKIFNEPLYWYYNSIDEFYLTDKYVFINCKYNIYSELIMPIGWLSNKNWARLVREKIRREYNRQIYNKLKR